MSVGHPTAISTDIQPELAIRAAQLPPYGLPMAPIAPQHPHVTPLRPYAADLRTATAGADRHPPSVPPRWRSAGVEHACRRMVAGGGRWDRGMQRAPSAGPAAGGGQVGAEGLNK